MDEKPTRAAAILAQCHQCMAQYQGGKEDCGNVKCSLYPYMPYAKLEPDLTWMKYNPKKKGLVTWEDSKREIDDDTRAALVERMEKAREARKRSVDENESED